MSSDVTPPTDHPPREPLELASYLDSLRREPWTDDYVCHELEHAARELRAWHAAKGRIAELIADIEGMPEGTTAGISPRWLKEVLR